MFFLIETLEETRSSVVFEVTSQNPQAGSLWKGPANEGGDVTTIKETATVGLYPATSY